MSLFMPKSESLSVPGKANGNSARHKQSRDINCVSNVRGQLVEAHVLIEFSGTIPRDKGS